MNNHKMDIAIIGYAPDYVIEKDGNLTGWWIDQVEDLAKVMDFVPNYVKGIVTFEQQGNSVGNRETRLATPSIIV